MKKVCFLALAILFIVFRSVPIYAQEESIAIDLTNEEREYLEEKGTIKIVVDPDWYPYEEINKDGKYVGIASELINLMARRTGLKFEVIPTSTWKESLEVAKAGQADAVSFLNKTDERSKWLLFTEPYFVDANVLITREEHDYISNISRYDSEIMVLPEGTSIEERLRRDYPGLKIIIVGSEEEAIHYIEEKKADFTIRSLTMAAYIIKNDGHFNLKIAGEIPNYKNQLRMGITKQDKILQSILNKGIATITEQDVQEAINDHISIKIMKGFDYKLFIVMAGMFSVVLIIVLHWMRKIQRLNRRLETSERNLRTLTEELKKKNDLLVASATTDVLTGLKNRLYFNQRVNEEFERFQRYNIPLSLLLIDIDHFKRINDLYGHAVGDEVLKKVTQELQNKLRKVDLLARWGGEEFIALLPDTGMDEAIDVAEKLRKQAEALVYENGEVITISIGVSTLTEAEAIEAWINRADKALYHAKRQGRNRYCVSSEAIEKSSYEIVKWDSAWISGQKEIDQQHIELLETCNELMSGILQADARESIIPKLEKIILDVKMHFKFEEGVLYQYHYSDVELHKKYHDDLIRKATELAKRSEEGSLLPLDVLHFILNDVLITHMLKEDTKFFELFL